MIHYRVLRVAGNDGPIAHPGPVCTGHQTLNYAGQSTSITQFYSMEDISPFLDSL